MNGQQIGKSRLSRERELGVDFKSILKISMQLFCAAFMPGSPAVRRGDALPPEFTSLYICCCKSGCFIDQLQGQISHQALSPSPSEVYVTNQIAGFLVQNTSHKSYLLQLYSGERKRTLLSSGKKGRNTRSKHSYIFPSFLRFLSSFFHITRDPRRKATCRRYKKRLTKPVL